MENPVIFLKKSGFTVEMSSENIAPTFFIGACEHHVPNLVKIFQEQAQAIADEFKALNMVNEALFKSDDHAGAFAVEVAGLIPFVLMDEEAFIEACKALMDQIDDILVKYFGENESPDEKGESEAVALDIKGLKDDEEYRHVSIDPSCATMGMTIKTGAEIKAIESTKPQMVFSRDTSVEAMRNTVKAAYPTQGEPSYEGLKPVHFFAVEELKDDVEYGIYVLNGDHGGYKESTGAELRANLGDKPVNYRLFIVSKDTDQELAIQNISKILNSEAQGK